MRHVNLLMSNVNVASSSPFSATLSCALWFDAAVVLPFPLEGDVVRRRLMSPGATMVFVLWLLLAFFAVVAVLAVLGTRAVAGVVAAVWAVARLVGEPSGERVGSAAVLRAAVERPLAMRTARVSAVAGLGRSAHSALKSAAA
jgi:hypothetical protein